MTASSDLASLIPSGQQVTWAMLEVDSLQTNGTVNLVVGGAIMPGIPCLNGYTPRAAGDTVLVAQAPFGWMVLGKSGKPADPIDTRKLAKKDQLTDVTWGTADPGTGWHKAETVWVKDNAIYAQTLGGGAPPTGDVPDPDPVTNGGSAGYYQGRHVGSTPKQGMYPDASARPWSGAWFFGDRIVNSASKGTVDYMEVTVTRSTKYHGNPRGQQVHLYLVPRGTTVGPEPNFYARWNGPKLSLGEDATARVPARWVTDLASGAAKGIGCDSGYSDYIIYTRSLDVTTYFK